MVLPRFTFVLFRDKIGDDEETSTRRVPGNATSGATTSTSYVYGATSSGANDEYGADAKVITSGQWRTRH